MNASARTQFRVGPADPRRSLFPLVARPASPLSGGASVFARATAAVRAQSARPNRFSSPQWNVATRWEAAVVSTQSTSSALTSPREGSAPSGAEPRTRWPESRR
ncbi:hypothetical protein M8J77_012287 [Diaphorina citri]|nr:hypothetical protein M8J77_012287 [Diaphorina citri]